MNEVLRRAEVTGPAAEGVARPGDDQRSHKDDHHAGVEQAALDEIEQAEWRYGADGVQVAQVPAGDVEAQDDVDG